MVGEAQHSGLSTQYSVLIGHPFAFILRVIPHPQCELPPTACGQMRPDPGPAILLPASAIGRASASEAEGSRFESAAGCHLAALARTA